MRRCAASIGRRLRRRRGSGYLDELGSPASKTETFVALKVEIGSWRWNSVPFYLRTGKRLPARVSEIVVTFKPIPHSVFDDSAGRSTPTGWSSACSPMRASSSGS
jgi:glucose-6-phosphate 1-dehydrogenase